MPTYKDITIHSWYLTPQKGRCSCQRISHTIEIAGLHSKAAKKNKLLSAIPAIQPVRNENLKHMASGFGYRTDPFTKARKMQGWTLLQK
jgi:hypothetical protein